MPPAILTIVPAETPAVEPFFIRCETCRARLRVRDERFLGQVQSCPKCGSMVHILAPAAAVMPQENSLAAGAEASSVGTTSFAALLRSPVALASAGGAAVLVVVGLIGIMALGGEDEVAVAPLIQPAVEIAQAVMPAERIEAIAPIEVDEMAVDEDTPAAGPVAVEPAATTDAFLPLEPIAEEKPEASDPPATSVVVEPQPTEETRKLTLEVVAPKSSSIPPATSSTAPPAEYVGVPEVDERSPVEADPPVLAHRPNRRTNVDDQLSVAIDTIELPAMPIGEFVSMISEMSAVPIRLDPKVLGDVGLSTRTQVVVKGGDITLGDLLARVLKEHQLTCVERDGELVVVRAKQ